MEVKVCQLQMVPSPPSGSEGRAGGTLPSLTCGCGPGEFSGRLTESPEEQKKNKGTKAWVPPHTQQFRSNCSWEGRGGTEIFLYVYLFIYFWLCWVFVAARWLSLVAASGGYSSLWCSGFSLWWLLLLWSTGSRSMGLVAPWHVGFSQTRARIRVPCIGRRILNHCATREVLNFFLTFK